MLEVVDALLSVWDAGRVGVHLSPAGTLHDMGDSNPALTFGYLARELSKRRIAFVCVRESSPQRQLEMQLRELFSGAYIANEGYTPASASAALAEGTADAIAFGRLFISNPDLTRRIAGGTPLSAWDEKTFYSGAGMGYTDYSEYVAD